MSREYTISHETEYAYDAPVSESYTVVHLQPRSDAAQFCRRYELFVSPGARVRTYVDRYDNLVQHFEILPRHERLLVRASSTVVAMAQPPAAPAAATRADLENDPLLDRYYDFLHESPYVEFTPELEAFASELPRPGDAIGSWCREVSRAIFERFAYDPAATSVHSTIGQSLATRAGVCQDFAHVMIAVVRAARIPARYASGYIFRGEAEGDETILGAEASHAWCEIYLPPYGWIGFDPTNDLLVNDHFVKIAIGRDYRDVSPVRGVYKGVGESEMSVNVAVEALSSQQ